MPDQAMSLFVRRLARGSPLDDAEQEILLGLPAVRREVEPNITLVWPGQIVDHSIVVGDGVLGRFDMMRNGMRSLTALHIPGDPCDLHSVVAPKAGWGITTLSRAVVFEVPHAELREAATRSPGIALAFWRDATLDGSIIAKWMANAGRKDARARLAHLFCEMGIRFEVAGLGSRQDYRLDVTQEQIADALGLTAVHVNRTLQALRTENLVVSRQRAIEIPDWERLANVAEFAPAYLLLDTVAAQDERPMSLSRQV